MKNRFMPGVTEKLGWYVYLLTDPLKNNEAFYVGKGSEGRAFAHIFDARQPRDAAVKEDATLARIRLIEAEGGDVGINILRHDLTEAQALMLESAAIDLLGFEQLTNDIRGHNSGRMSVVEINARYAKPVEIDPDHQVVLINIRNSYFPGISDAELFERTRKWWLIAEPRREAGGPGAPVWAFAVAGGVVRAVYRIDKWEGPTKEEIAVDSSHSRRWAFRGTRDHEMEERYLNGDVSRYVTSQWPLRFLTSRSEGAERRPLTPEGENDNGATAAAPSIEELIGRKR